MRIHQRLLLPLAASLMLVLASCASTGPNGILSADAPRALPESGPVSVTWNDPATFTEFRNSSNRWAAAEGDWLQDLAKHMRKRAVQQLAPGEHLELNIVDIERAGQYEPWHRPGMQDVRIVRDMFPPSMTVAFRLHDATGAVVDEGERKLIDQAFLTNASPINVTDPLRYEKRMIDNWLRRELVTAAR